MQVTVVGLRVCPRKAVSGGAFGMVGFASDEIRVHAGVVYLWRSEKKNCE